MGGHKHFACSTEPKEIPTPPPPVADWHIVAAPFPPIPDCRGDYFEDGTQNEFPAYRTENSAWWLWYYDLHWIISDVKGSIASYIWWLSTDATIEGVFDAQDDAQNSVAANAGPA